MKFLNKSKEEETGRKIFQDDKYLSAWLIAILCVNVIERNRVIVWGSASQCCIIVSKLSRIPSFRVEILYFVSKFLIF